MQNSPLQLNNLFFGKLVLIPSKPPITAEAQLRIQANPVFRRFDANHSPWVVELSVAFKAVEEQVAAYEGEVQAVGMFIFTDASVEEMRSKNYRG
jgi:preprotein translocase subunit SecB